MRLPIIAAAIVVAVASQQAPVRTLSTDLEIGGPDEARDTHIFSSIAGLAFDSTGRIVVMDLKDNFGRVFDAQGKHVYRFGRPGAGPGDFGSALVGAFGPDGLFWVRDENNARVSAFELGPQRATFKTSVPLGNERPSPSRLVPIGFHGGRLISPAAYRGTATGRPVPYRNCLDMTGRIVGADTVVIPKGDSIADGTVTVPMKKDGQVTGQATWYYYQPYGASLEVAYAVNGDYARAVSTKYDIEWRDATGKVLRRIRRDVTGPALSARERTKGEAQVNAFLKRAGLSASSRYRVPERKAPIAAMAFDQLGRLWVRRALPDGSNPEADIYDGTGRQIAVVRWPKNIDPMYTTPIAARGNHVLGIASDSLGAEWVVRLVMK
jgi:hypothetical protein